MSPNLPVTPDEIADAAIAAAEAGAKILYGLHRVSWLNPTPIKFGRLAC